MKTPKFEIDELVKAKGDLDKEGGKVLSYSFSPATGFIYTVEEKSIDFDKKEVNVGVITLAEDEIEKVGEGNTTSMPTVEEHLPENPVMPAPAVEPVKPVPNPTSKVEGNETGGENA